ncbi:4-coumarate--CoA ligase family protein [Wenjunlia tyrosinilytica]|uniref:AMP-dependent synthetase n=1 Tax=Wenjunlia tyrosinilytica TaxID=1544741 RepID=A0A917ZVD5_9ACTN|nr:4-coumarate--CoA ligase family protein [Wenjunlia tyrosinilytica]GGO96105.1 AMP-dependent synthetase [Wenjunlia tyrosinilytica]
MVFHSEYSHVPVIDRPIHDVVLGDAASYGDSPALIDGLTGETVTYAQLDHDHRRVAAALAESGLRKGDVLALFSPNTVLFPVVFYGATRAGATVTTISSLATAEDLSGQLRDSGARWIVTVSAFLPTVTAAVETLAAEAGDGQEPRVREVIVCDRAEGHRGVQDLIASTAPEPHIAFDPGEDVAVLPYSSGTTGTPKGVMLTHRSVATNLAQVDPLHHEPPGVRTLAVIPFFHVYGLTALMNAPLRHGCTVVVLPRFELAQFLGAIAEHRVNGLFVAPPIVLALAKHPVVDRYDLSSVKWVVCSAAPLDADLAEACARRLDVPTIRQAYGMTELSPGAFVVPADELSPPPGTVGKMIPNTELRVVSVDDPDKELGAGESGELLIRGPQVMKGYLGRPEATDAMVDADGWLHTGDIGHLDERGYLFVVDRVKELIKHKGYQVAPAELEAVLLTHEAVADAAVIGVYDEDGNEIPKAFVVTRPGMELTEDDIVGYVAAKVAPYKKVRAVEFIDTVPKAASGKILRRELRAREALSRERSRP